MDRLVFSIYSRGEKLNRIRCRRIRVSIFHKIGGSPNTGKVRFEKYTGLYFLYRYAIFFQNFAHPAGKTRKNYDANRACFFSRVCKLCVTCGSCAMESRRVLNVVRRLARNISFVFIYPSTC